MFEKINFFFSNCFVMLFGGVIVLGVYVYVGSEKVVVYVLNFDDG